MIKVISVFLALISTTALAVEFSDVAPENCVKIKELESMSQNSIADSKIMLKEEAMKLGADIVHLKEAKEHIASVHDLADITLNISKGVAFKCANKNTNSVPIETSPIEY